MFIDFKELKKAVSFEHAMRALGLQMKQTKPNEFRSACPSCNSGGDRVLVVTTDLARDDGSVGSYCCHADGHRGGDVIKFVAHVQGHGDQRQAAEFLHDHFGKKAESRPQLRQKSESDGRRGIEAVRDRLAFEHEDVQSLGISAASAAALGIGYIARGVAANRVLFPIRSESGELLAYCGLAVSDDQSPRYWFPKDFEEVVEAKVISLASRR